MTYGDPVLTENGCPILRPGLVETPTNPVPPPGLKPVVLVSTWADFYMRFRGGWDATQATYKKNDVVQFTIDGYKAHFVCDTPHVSNPHEPPLNNTYWREWSREHRLRNAKQNAK